MIRSNRLLLLVASLLFVCGAAGAADNESPPSAAGHDYQISPGDILQVTVWKEDGMDQKVAVRPDGGISFPLIGNTQVAGKTVDQIQHEVTQRLSKFIPEPVVNVTVLETQGNTIFVIGKVNKPGGIEAGRYIDVMQALSMAGGLTPFASENKIKVLRRVNGKMSVFPFEYGEVKRGDNLDQNIVLKGGDTVVVP